MATKDEMAAMRAVAVQLALEGKLREADNIKAIGKMIEASGGVEDDPDEE